MPTLPKKNFKGTKLMKWHPVSLDVNLIENLESINNNKKRNVNENEKQYANKDVCNVIIVASSNIKTEAVEKLT